MAQAKIELKLGSHQFTGEADAAWLEKQLDKFLAYASSFKDDDEFVENSAQQPETKLQSTKETLSSYLKSSSVASNQVKKFLATAGWLTTTGISRPATAEITKTLSEHHQGKLGNPAHCLNQNVTKGFCVKAGKQFYVTEEGFSSLGKSAS